MSVIRASEVGEFVFCARAWWLRRAAGQESAGHERRAAGIVRHAHHGRTVALSQGAWWLGIALLIGGVLLLVIAWL
ncbi:MAG: hypothetical protein EOM24_18645 [Chloroflexia bacterium]|nr:hypothetical protein [Chloroflexia bacterium]